MRHPVSTCVGEAGPDMCRAQPMGSGGIGGAQATQSPSTGRAPGVDR